MPEKLATSADPGMGCVTISVTPGAGRTIVPVIPGHGDVTLYRIVFDPADGGSAYTEDRLPARLFDPVYLEPGNYTLTVTAFIGTDKPLAQGSASGVAINAGGSTPVTVTLRAINAAGLSGSFKYTVGFPQDTAAATLEVARLNDSGSAVSEINLLAGGANLAMGTLVLNTGYYNVVITLEKAGQKLVWRELLHIYANLESVFARAFTNDDFYRSHYTVTFQFDNGDADGTASVLHGGTASKPADPGGKSTGFVFDGWYTDSAFVHEYDFDDAVINDITLYTQWIKVDVILIDGGGHEAGYDYLIDALDAITTTGKYTVEIYADQPSFAPYTLSIEGTDITLIAPVAPVTISLSDTGSLFTIEDGVSLTLEDGVTLRGRDDNNVSLVYVNGGGTFTMRGGEISGNTATTYGGGVYVEGEFTMFTMNGGKIINNTAGYGCVFVDGGTFTMKDGTISENTAASGGGGVFVYGIFTMIGGEISGNEANVNGGGVFAGDTSNTSNTNVRFTMTNGTISGNSAANNCGGGVCLVDSEFTMSGGTISGNAAITGGGVHVGIFSIGSTFNLGGTAVIQGNVLGLDNTSTDNVDINNDRYIRLLTDDFAPADGMNVGVHTRTPSGVIVQTGATAGVVEYFFADEGGKSIIHSNGQLVIE